MTVTRRCTSATTPSRCSRRTGSCTSRSRRRLRVDGRAARRTSTLPETTIISAPLDPSTSTTATFTFSADQAGATFQCSLDLAPFTPCASPLTYTEPRRGRAHASRSARAAPIGIPDQSPAMHEWTVDLPPETTIDSGPPTQTLSPIAHLRLLRRTSRWPSFECSLDGVAFGPCCRESAEFLDLLPGHARAAASAPSTRSATSTRRRRSTAGRVGPPPDTFDQLRAGGGHREHDARPSSSPPTCPASGSSARSTRRSRTCSSCRARPRTSYTDLALRRARAPRPRRGRRRQRRPDPGRVELGDRRRSRRPVLITSGPDLTTSDRSARFEFSAEGTDRRSYECSLDGGEFSPCMLAEGLQRPAARPARVRGPACSRARRLAVDAPVVDLGVDGHRHDRPRHEITDGPPAVTGGIDPEAGGDATVAVRVHRQRPARDVRVRDRRRGVRRVRDPVPVLRASRSATHIFRVRAVLIDPNDPTVNVDPTPARWLLHHRRGAGDLHRHRARGRDQRRAPRHFVFSSTVSGSTFECALDLGPFAAVRQPVRR